MLGLRKLRDDNFLAPTLRTPEDAIKILHWRRAHYENLEELYPE